MALILAAASARVSVGASVGRLVCGGESRPRGESRPARYGPNAGSIKRLGDCRLMIRTGWPERGLEGLDEFVEPRFAMPREGSVGERLGVDFARQELPKLTHRVCVDAHDGTVPGASEWGHSGAGGPPLRSLDAGGAVKVQEIRR